MSLTTFLLDNSGSNVDSLETNNSIPYINFGTGDYEIDMILSMDLDKSASAGMQPFIISQIGANIYFNSTNVNFIFFFIFAGTLSVDVPFDYVNNQFIQITMSRVNSTTTATVKTINGSYSNVTSLAYDATNSFFRFGQLGLFKADIYYLSVAKAGVNQLLIQANSITGPFASANVITYNHNGSSTTSISPFPFTVRSVSGVIPCFGEGTQILTIENEEEKYVAVEKLVEGSVVKTYKHGARKIAKIVSGSFINDPQEPKRCMYKLPKTDAMTNDLILTGGHAVLVDESPKGLQFKIDDKYLSFAENNADFEKIDDHQIYKYYNFSIENDGDKDRRFGVWANGVLCETPSEKQLDSFNQKMLV
jgi:hypothetical protein